jgi:PIN domain nuclease of toxin-antitoxin system
MQVAPERFISPARALIEESENDLFLSAASSWEIAIKHALGRLRLPASPSEYVPDRLAPGGVSPLQIDHTHVLRVATLPMHHRDPFDRLLIAQAQLERMEILTADRQFEPYDVMVRWAVQL